MSEYQPEDMRNEFEQATAKIELQSDSSRSDIDQWPIPRRGEKSEQYVPRVDRIHDRPRVFRAPFACPSKQYDGYTCGYSVSSDSFDLTALRLS